MAFIKSRLHVSDTVAIIKGKDLGKTGRIEAVDAKNGKVLVENINLVKKHVKPRGQQQGGIITVNKPISIANVQLVCPSCKKRTRIGYEIKNQDKQRICKQCGVIITKEAKK